jgi:hypothetical protein
VQKIVLNFIIILTLFVSLQASQKSLNKWEFERFNFYFEDDVYTKTDDGYSAGERLSFLYNISNEDYLIYDALFMDFGETNSYFTFAITNQIFTPTDTQTTELIEDDRPYAGWTYLEGAIHKSSKTHLRSLSLQIGMIGKASFSEEIQNGVHKMLGSEHVNGWHNQLENELGINLKYTHKRKLDMVKRGVFEAHMIPFVSAELGNIATNITAGVSNRVGYNIQQDFGVSSINIGADPGIPAYGALENIKKRHWSFSLNLIGAVSAVARDIFLDGNTFVDSHSVDKENFVYYYGFGFTLRYKKFLLDFMQVTNSKKFKEQPKSHGVGTIIISWLF